MKRQRTPKLLEIATTMPFLPHSVPGQPFDIMHSGVAAWLVEQPNVRQWLFESVKTRNLIVFDGKLRTWRGRMLVGMESAKTRETKEFALEMLDGIDGTDGWKRVACSQEDRN